MSSVSTKYYFPTGLASEVTDLNGTTTTFAYNDPLSHLTQSVRAANRGEPLINQTTVSYNYAGRTVASTSDLNGYNDNQLKSEQVYDGLGRPVESRAYESAFGFIKSAREYDAAGRVSKVCNDVGDAHGTACASQYVASDVNLRHTFLRNLWLALTSAQPPDGYFLSALRASIR